MTEEGPYGALLIDFDSHEFPLFRQITTLSPVDYRRYRDAYDVLASYLDESMMKFVSNCCDDLLNYVIDYAQRAHEQRTLSEVDDRGANVFDMVCSLALAATNSFFVVQDQHILKAINAGEMRGDDTEVQVKRLFHSLEDENFGYRTVLNLRNALVHVSIRSLKFKVSISVSREPSITLDISREDVLATRKLQGKSDLAKARRAELASLRQDPSLFDLLEEAMPAFVESEFSSRQLIYPEAVRREAAMSVCDLIDLFQGQRGTYCLQTGPGMTPDKRQIPNHQRLIPEVLALAESIIRPGKYQV